LANPDYVFKILTSDFLREFNKDFWFVIGDASLKKAFCFIYVTQLFL